jgi:hypothetical protein
VCVDVVVAAGELLLYVCVDVVVAAGELLLGSWVIVDC